MKLVLAITAPIFFLFFFGDLMLNSLTAKHTEMADRADASRHSTLVIYQFSALMPKTTEKTHCYTNKEMKQINIKRKIQGNESDFMVNVVFLHIK